MKKRLFDLVVVIATAIFWLPLLVFLALSVALFLGRPVFFTQIRPGKYGKPFKIIKFRTMTEDTDVHGNLMLDVDRLTSFGKFLRNTSLDELPEVFNVLKGEMSLVGPRPLLMEYLSLYTPEQARRHEVYPGITGWAQINGRNEINWDEKFRLDVWYVENHTLKLDVRILFLTVFKVIKRVDISQTGEATVKKFTGNGRE
jgi:lipopolysaccharide/colanic/teichoic acid biosynthesis glycosyltransferase